MKIIITNSSPIWGGNENWAVTAARLLLDRNHDVKMILKKNSEVVKRAQKLNIPLILIPRFGGDFEFPTLLRLYKIFRKEKPDAGIYTNTKDYWVCGLTSWIAKVPLRILRLSIVRKVKDHLKYKLIYLHFINRIIVNSREVDQTIRQSTNWLKNIDIQLLYNGIAIPESNPSWINRQKEIAKSLRKQYAIPDNAFIFGACVNITRRKRLDLIISALSLLSDKLPHSHAFLAGDGNERENLEDQAKKLKIHNRIHFPGYFDDVTPLYYLFDLYVISSQQESMTYVGMQALSHSCPVLATDCGGIRELLDNGRCGKIIPVNDVQALSDSMLELATNHGLRNKYAANGNRYFRKNFTLEKMGDNLERILKIKH